MGIPIDPSGEFGNDCPYCTPTLFISGETPKFVTASISGSWKACPDKSLPPGVWVLEQNPVWPCTWKLIAAGVYCEWYPGTVNSYLFMGDDVPPPIPKYFTSQAGACATRFTNSLTENDCLAGHGAYGGFCDITWLGD